MNKAPEGMYIPGPGKYDMTGDGVNDIAVVMTKAESEARKDEFAAEKLPCLPFQLFFLPSLLPLQRSKHPR